MEESEIGSSSEDGQSLVASLRKMVKKEAEVTVKAVVEEFVLRKEFLLILLNLLLQMIEPRIMDLFRKVVKEEMQGALRNFLPGGNWINTNVADVPTERRLCLKFLGEEPDDALTGKEIKGKGGTQMMVGLFDEVTGNLVESGVESSAKVEILLREAIENDNEQNLRCQDLNSRITKESDRSKPHLAKSYHIYLENGIGELTNAKLAHDKTWKKSCMCRLGARVVNLNGIPVQEAWTEPFVISDSRSKLYRKHKCPSLDDEVWRLVNIGKGGAPHKRLKEIKVFTVKDFLFLLSIDPHRLREKLGSGVGDKFWKAIVDHAQTCIIDDPGICVYNASSEHNMSVVFDVVGGMKGVIRDSKYVVIDDLQETEKNHAYELLRSVVDNRDAKKLYKDETDLMKQLSHQASSACEIVVSRRISCNSAPSEIMAHCDPTQPGTSSPSTSPPVGPSVNDVSHVDSLGLTARVSSNTNEISRVESLANPISSPDIYSDFDKHGFEAVLKFIYAGSPRFFVAAKCILWWSRARKRVQSSSQRDVPSSKRQKI